jgi:hypothetical protein
MAYVAAISSVIVCHTLSVGTRYTHLRTANAQSETSVGIHKDLTLLLPDINTVMDGDLMRANKLVTCQQSCVELCLLHQNSHRSQTDENIVTAAENRTRISSAVYLVLEQKLRISAQ